MAITVSIPDQLSDYAVAQGLSVKDYVEELAARAAKEQAISSEEERHRAVEGLLAFRNKHHLTSGRGHGVGIRAWLHHDHKR